MRPDLTLGANAEMQGFQLFDADRVPVPERTRLVRRQAVRRQLSRTTRVLSNTIVTLGRLLDQSERLEQVTV